MKTVFKKMLSLVLVAMLLVSAIPFQASAAEGSYKITFALKNSEDGSAVGSDLEYGNAPAKMEFYAGKIVAGMYGYEVVGFAANGNTYGPNDYFIPTEDTRVAVYVKVEAAGGEGEDKGEVTPPEEDKEEDKDDVTPPAEDKKEPAAATYTIQLNVYQVKDNEAKEWDSISVTLDKPSATLSELVAKSGYGSYEYAYAMIDGSRFWGTAAIAIENGDQIDLFVTPSKGGDKNDKPSTGTTPSKPGKGEKVTLRVFHNDGTSNYTDITCRTTDNLLNVIYSSEELSELSRDGYKLIGWAFEANNDADQEWIAAQHKVSDDDDLRVYADWQETKPGKGDKPSTDDDDDDGEDEVLLKIYVNGNTKSAAKVVDMDAYDNDGKITLAEATKVVNKYYEQASDDDDMDIDGLFTYKTWNGGDYSMKNAKNSITVNEKGDTIIYVMVRDAQKISSGTADSTNPKTGDTIFMAVTVMALSATALAAVYVFNKKRAVK